MMLRGIGLNARNIVIHPLAVSEYILVPVMLRCANISEELSAAAVTRGIERSGKRTSLHELAIGFGDFAVTIAFASLVVFSLLGGLVAFS
jgi:energy-coupling factor transport system permease protein